MADLVNMIETPDADDCGPCYASDAKPAYPYQLQISLDDDDLKKLGVDSLPDIGAMIDLTAKVKVIRIQDETGFYGRQRNLGLQITDMALGKPSNPDAAEDGNNEPGTT